MSMRAHRTKRSTGRAAPERARRLDPHRVRGYGFAPVLLALGLAQSIALTAAAAASSDSPHPSEAPPHWSLQPLRPHGATASLSATAAGTPAGATASVVDALIEAKLRSAGLALAPPADRRTLLRRLSFTLLGLPPTPAEVETFVRDTSDRAYEKQVERMLASPHYGERWGRHWLDAVRYTESQGFEYDRLRDQAWHYRDYVIRSFNEDKPYHRFMMEQVAGDVMEPITADGVVATSLLVCGPWDEAGNAQANATQKAITREDELEDTLAVVSQTFLGLTMNCARCHAHKFDPIPQEEYYQVKAVFEGVKHGQRPFAGSAEQKQHEARLAGGREQIAAAQAEVARLEAEGQKRAAAARTQPKQRPGPTALLRWDFANSPASTSNGALHGGATIAEGRLVLPTDGAYFASSPLPRDVREKSLEAWVSLADLKQGGGAAISIERDGGKEFDSIVFGERQPRKWMAGSAGFIRTKDLTAPEESASPTDWVHLVVVYHADQRVALYRNGEPYGEPYAVAQPPVLYAAGASRILLGLRHTGGGRPWLRGAIRHAALYDRALSPAEVADAFHAQGWGIALSETLAALTAEERRQREDALARSERARAALAAIPALPVSYVGTRVQPAPTKLLRRGDVKQPADVVAPGALSAVKAVPHQLGLAPDAPEGVRRLKFAQWMADPQHPLPARVMVNRVWQWHFGNGLVSTPNDFGVAGARPSHPELLDWLAAQFIQSGWSIKHLHRLIVHSQVFRQSSAWRESAATADADNVLLWRFPPRRLEAEALRDAALALSGQMNWQMGGPSFRPFETLKYPANAYVPVDKSGPVYDRRTIYRMNVNSGKEPLLDAFDCPDPAVKTPRRGSTTTPLQALALMNNAFVLRQSKHLAERVQTAAQNQLAAAVDLAYQLALGRPPEPPEQARAVAVAQERGLPSVCWALLNSTEFVYVR